MSGASRARRLLPKTLLLALATLSLAGVLLLGLSSGPADAATIFTVNKTGDAGDRKINGVCDASRKRGKQCTLRAAIQEANAALGADTINFNIGGTASVKTIAPGRPLPNITDPVTIDGYTQPGASSNTQAQANDAVLKIQLKGTNAGEDANGLTIEAANSTIKGLVINRFGLNGVLIAGSGATGNKVEGNFIGTNADGTGDLGNGSNGVFVFGDSNTVGGSQPDKRNVISGNDGDGVFIFGFVAGNKVEGNLVGTDAGGTGDLGNGRNGVFIQSAENNTVGGTAAGTRNVISGNDRRGVVLFGATGNKVEGNRIGTDAGGAGALGNGSDGVFIQSAENNTVGGTASGAGNRIAHNGRAGVLVFGSTSAGNRVLSNSTSSNTGLGIDLGTSGVTNNDAADPDTGANNLQNFPVITSIIQSSSFLNPTRISGTLNSNPSQNFTVQCFLAGEIPEDADTSGHGEGKVFMAEDTDVTTNASGDGSFECDFLFPVSLEGKRWSATATNEATGDTSEFSANFPGE